MHCFFHAKIKLNPLAVLEAGRSLPPYPSVFLKPTTSLADYGEAVPIPPHCQDEQVRSSAPCSAFATLITAQADYEGELCVVIGKTCRNVPKDQVYVRLRVLTFLDSDSEPAQDVIAGYTAGDDVSSRKWQRDPKFAGGVPQWCYSKGMDKFAPCGPALLSQKARYLSHTAAHVAYSHTDRSRPFQTASQDVRERRQAPRYTDIGSLLRRALPGLFPQSGNDSTRWNRHHGALACLCYSAPNQHIGQTGTPGGVGFGMKPPQHLKDGDIGAHLHSTKSSQDILMRAQSRSRSARLARCVIQSTTSRQSCISCSETYRSTIAIRERDLSDMTVRLDPKMRPNRRFRIMAV